MSEYASPNSVNRYAYPGALSPADTAEICTLMAANLATDICVMSKGELSIFGVHRTLHADIEHSIGILLVSKIGVPLIRVSAGLKVAGVCNYYAESLHTELVERGNNTRMICSTKPQYIIRSLHKKLAGILSSTASILGDKHAAMLNFVLGRLAEGRKDYSLLENSKLLSAAEPIYELISAFANGRPLHTLSTDTYSHIMSLRDELNKFDQNRAAKAAAISDFMNRKYYHIACYGEAGFTIGVVGLKNTYSESRTFNSFDANQLDGAYRSFRSFDNMKEVDPALYSDVVTQCVINKQILSDGSLKGATFAPASGYAQIYAPTPAAAWLDLIPHGDNFFKDMYAVSWWYSEISPRVPCHYLFEKVT